MIDFTKFDLEKLAKVMKSLRGKIDRTDYFERGTILEKAVETYSRGQLTRINEDGKDFKGFGDKTYEQKGVEIKKKVRGGPQISNFVLKNWRNSTRKYDKTMMADFYVFLDINDMKMCVVPQSFIKIKNTAASNVTACCDPLPEHFVDLPKVEDVPSFFEMKKKWVDDLLDSI